MQFLHLHFKHPNILRTIIGCQEKIDLESHHKCANKGQTEMQERWSADLIADAFQSLQMPIFTIIGKFEYPDIKA